MNRCLRLRALSLIFGLVLAAGGIQVSAADQFDGTLMPVKCQNDEPASHARSCALDCAASGLGILTDAGDFLEFDAAGDEKALAWLKATTRTTDLKVRVTGTLKDGLIQVERIADR